MIGSRLLNLKIVKCIFLIYKKRESKKQIDQQCHSSITFSIYSEAKCVCNTCDGLAAIIIIIIHLYRIREAIGGHADFRWQLSLPATPLYSTLYNLFDDYILLISCWCVCFLFVWLNHSLRVLPRRVCSVWANRVCTHVFIMLCFMYTQKKNNN